MAQQTVTVPHNFAPRHYQLPVLKALDGGAKRVVAVWHRRSGKEKTFINYTAKAMLQRVGTYFYLFPTYAQAKKAVWDGRDRDGFAFIDHFPPPLVQSKNITDLQVKLINGSVFQLIGTDNIDSIMSTNPIGCVFAEYSLQDPRGWEYVRPILRENGGWAIFDFTPRGKNHGWDIYQLAVKLQAEGDPTWFAQRLTVADTGVLSPGDIDAERREGMDEDLIQQEFYCSFSGANQGAYFAKQMAQAEDDGRVTRVPYQTEAAVDTWWDLGVGDATAIWFTQNIGREVHVIDYYEESGEGLPHYAKVLQGKGYVYGTHNAPHDIRVRELGSGKSRIETAANLGFKFEIVPQISLDDGIDAARSFIGRCWFDRDKTERGRNALVTYAKTWDDKRKMFSSSPFHNWASHGADAFRYLAVGHKSTQMRKAISTRQVVHAGGGSGTGWMGA